MYRKVFGMIGSVCALIVPVVSNAASSLDCLAGAANFVDMAQLGRKCVKDQSGLHDTRISNIIHALMMGVLALVAVLAIIAFVVSGILYMTSAGDTDQMDRAKRAALYGVYGLVFALSGLIIINTINMLLGG